MHSNLAASIGVAKTASTYWWPSIRAGSAGREEKAHFPAAFTSTSQPTAAVRPMRVIHEDEHCCCQCTSAVLLYCSSRESQLLSFTTF